MLRPRTILAVRNLTISAAATVLCYSAHAADRVLDFSTGCKAYQLQNRAWVPVDSAALEGMEIANSQILKDEKFTVFRGTDGTYGVNQKCVRLGNGGEASSVASPPPPPTARTRSRRGSPRMGAARAQGNGYFDNRGKWAAAVSLGMNLAPSGTITAVRAGTTSTFQSNFKSTLAFAGEASYRWNRMFRFAAELGLSQLQENTSGNEVSYFVIRPEIPFRVSKDIEMFVGPSLGLFFLSQNAETISDSLGTVSVKQQSPSALLIGAKIGADYAMNEQFDLGVSLAYFMPGALKITGTQTAPTADTFSSSLTAKFMTFSARFVVHF